MKILRRAMPHACIILSVIMLTLIVIDFVNDAMGFLRGGVFKTLLIVYVAAVLLTAVLTLVANARESRVMKGLAGEEASAQVEEPAPVQEEVPKQEEAAAADDERD